MDTNLSPRRLPNDSISSIQIPIINPSLTASAIKNRQLQKRKSLGSERKQQREFLINADEENHSKNFESNYIKTTKYTFYNFVFKCLIFQFKRVANIYFLLIVILQSIPQISPLNPVTAIIPLVFVLLVSMAREFLEDFARYREDKRINSSPVRIFNPAKKTDSKNIAPIKSDSEIEANFEWLPSRDLKVGQIVLMYEEEVFPADLILIGTSNPDLTCYVETSSLDGEKNLKKKFTFEEINKLSRKEMISIHAKVFCKPQSKSITDFDGTIENFHIGLVKALNEKQLLLKGARLKNTAWVTAVVAYTGIETKIMINSQQGGYKQSKVEKIMNRLIFIIMGLQTILCLIMSSLSAWIHEEKIDDHIYIGYDEEWYTPFYINFFSYFLLFNTLIPISLIVSLEIAKFLQVIFMEGDVFMFHNNEFTKVSACSINEELGQVRYIFSDKTGTLTVNTMDLKLIRIRGQNYGDNKLLETESANVHLIRRMETFNDKKNVSYSFKDDVIKSILRNEIVNDNISSMYVRSSSGKTTFHLRTEKDQLQEFVQLLACCHDCVAAFNKKGEITNYQGPSPDEITLVESARQIGAAFIENKNNKIKLKYSDHSVKEIELLHLFEFTSARKRMSVIIRDSDGFIKLYAKGADAIIEDRLDPTQIETFLKDDTTKFLKMASVRGFRTLMMAIKIIDEQEYQDWLKIYTNAELDIDHKAQKVEEAVDMIEQNLVYFGCSVVEDKLQDNVPETIAHLQSANISIWMLTGDKLETAENIGKSCRLFTEEMLNSTYIFNTPDLAVLSTELESKAQMVVRPLDPPMAMIVDSKALATIMLSYALRKNFVTFAKKCVAIICCRASPSQKAEVVRAIKESCDDITLAIGDGANDVSMILEAHLGVGIYGKEGRGAAQSADFAIGEFQSLWNLLLVHGRLNYIRIAEMILYFFYKNLVFTFPQLAFGFWCSYSGQTFFDDFFISFYNLFFTSLPLGFKALLEHDLHHLQDQDININALFPYLYHIGQYSSIFNLKNYSFWVLKGLVHSCILFFIPLHIWQYGILSSDGVNGDIWSLSVTCYTSIVIVVNIKLIDSSRYFTIWNMISFGVLSIGIYFLYAYISTYLSFSNTYATMEQTFSSPLFYFTVILNCSFVFILDYFLKVFKFLIINNSTDYTRAWAKKNKKSPEPEHYENKFKTLKQKNLNEIAVLEKKKKAFNSPKHLQTVII